MATVDGKGRTLWTPLVGEFERTDGITQAAFARQYGIKAGTFRKWLYQLRAERKASKMRPRFASSRWTRQKLQPGRR